MKILAAFLSCLSLLSACGKDISYISAKTRETVKNGSDSKDGHIPGNIFRCDTGNVMGLDVTFDSEGKELHQYYIDGVKLEQHLNVMATDPRNGFRYKFWLELPNLRVAIADSTGRGLLTLSCRRDISKIINPLMAADGNPI